MATAILSEASPAAVEPVTPTLQQRLKSELDVADLAIDEVDSFIHVCNFALRQQDCDVDGDVACVLDNAWEKVRAAREAIQNATDLLSEVVNG